MAQTVKHLPTMQETWVQSLGREDALEKEMAIHSSTIAWKIPWTEELGAGYCPWGRKESAGLSDFTFTFKMLFGGKVSLKVHEITIFASSLFLFQN